MLIHRVNVALVSLLIAASSVLMGCSPLFKRNDLPPTLNKTSQISPFPFFEQGDYQCAPAAASMMLVHLGHQIEPEELAQTIYTPKRKGSFQPDLVSSLRRQGTIPYQINNDMSSLLSTVSDGYPVIVLINLGLDWIPFFHYGIVVGYDLSRDNIVFTSGRKELELIDIETFAKMWKRADNWALLVVNPGDVPKNVDHIRFLQAAAAIEQSGYVKEAKKTYLATLKSWGDNTETFVSLGNVSLIENRYSEAAKWFKKALNIEPNSAIILNNYAWALAKSSRWKEAKTYSALALKYDQGECKENCQDTLRYIESHMEK